MYEKRCSAADEDEGSVEVPNFFASNHASYDRCIDIFAIINSSTEHILSDLNGYKRLDIPIMWISREPRMKLFALGLLSLLVAAEANLLDSNLAYKSPFGDHPQVSEKDLLHLDLTNSSNHKRS